MLTVSQLRNLKPAEFEEAADGWHKVSSSAGAAKDRVDNEIAAKLPHSQKGAGVDAALVRLRRLSGNFHYTQVECGLVRAALNGLAAELRAAQKKLNDALADADAEKFTVKPDGSVHWVSTTTTVPFSPEQSAPAGSRPSVLVEKDPQRAKAQAYADRIGTALKDATEADSRYSRTLSRLKADNDLTASNSDWLDAQQDMGAVRKTAGGYLQLDDIPKGKSAKENAEWWKGLSADERGDYATLFPASVGALDGIPSDVRDDANRTVLAEKRAEYQTRLHAIPPEPTPRNVPMGQGYGGYTLNKDWVAWTKRWTKERTELEASLKGMDAIENRFNNTGKNGLPEAYLLGFDPEGNGRAIIANGNPDTADHTAVYVPGTTSNLSKIDGDINRMTDLWRESDALVDGKSVSTITWLGYDAPQGIVKDAPFSHYADDGAPALNSFMEGLNTSSQSGADSHTTVIGHSYGTTVVGSAARQGELSADDVIFAGSPGVQVGSAEDMDVPRGHVWNQEADGDPVPNIGRYGHGGSQWKIGGGVGIIPSDEIFGANQMSTDTKGHSDYWNYGSQSLKNQASVVMGQYGEVKRDG